MKATDQAVRWLEEERTRRRVPHSFGVRLSHVAADAKELQYRYVAERRAHEVRIQLGTIAFFVSPDLVPRLSNQGIDVQQDSDHPRLVLLPSDAAEREAIAASA